MVGGVSDRSGPRRGIVVLMVAVVATLSGCTGSAPSASDQVTSTSNPTAATAGATSSAPPVATGVVQGKDGWSTYTNAKLGFSVRFPTRIYGSSGSPCVKKQTNGVWSYQASPGVVPAAIRRLSNDFIITQRYGYLPTVSGYRADGSPVFGSCPKTRTTSSMFHTEDLPPVAALGLTVHPQFARADVEQWVRGGYDFCGRRMKVTFTPGASGAWTSVTFTCPRHPPSVATAPEMRWYQDADLYVEFSFGFLSDVENVAEKNVERKIADTFGPV